MICHRLELDAAIILYVYVCLCVEGRGRGGDQLVILEEISHVRHVHRPACRNVGHQAAGIQHIGMSDIRLRASSSNWTLGSTYLW